MDDMEALYHQYRRFLIKICRRYARFYDLDDLLQTAYFGLIKAAENFDESLGFKFTTYLHVWVKRYILTYLLTTKSWEPARSKGCGVFKDSNVDT
jgi:RNA polymerase sigma factor (sigma-70 family)